MTEREKMIEIVLDTEITGIKLRNITGGMSTANAIADALIAANIGDVTEWKERVECAKRILQIPTLPNGTTDLSYFEYKGERIQDIARQRDEYKHRAEVAERNDKIKDRALNDACYALARIYNPNDSKVVVGKGFRENYIQQAEREVEEEKND